MDEKEMNGMDNMDTDTIIFEDDEASFEINMKN